MSEFTFYKAWSLLRELGEPGGLGAPPGGPMGGPPGGGLGGPPGGGLGGPMGGPPPMGGGGMGGPPGMGGMGDPMGGGMGGQPVPVKTISISDVWEILDKIVKGEKYEEFFDEISINKQPEPQVWQKPKQSSLHK